MRKLRLYLKSPDFGVKLLIGSVIVQGFHTFFVFCDLSNFSEIPKIISSIFYSTILSFAILYYTMNNQRIVALRFQIFESSINLYYFFAKIAIMLVSDQISLLQVVPRSIMAIAISIMMPYIIFEYAGSIKEEKDDIKEKSEVLNAYEKTKIRNKSRQDLLKQINSMEDIKKLNKKYLSNGK